MGARGGNAIAHPPSLPPGRPDPDSTGPESGAAAKRGGRARRVGPALGPCISAGCRRNAEPWRRTLGVPHYLEGPMHGDSAHDTTLGELTEQAQGQFDAVERLVDQASERISQAAARAQQAQLEAEQATTTASLAHISLAHTQERLAAAKERELAAHRRAAKLHQDAVRAQQRLGHPDRAAKARRLADHARDLHRQALAEPAEQLEPPARR